MKTIKIYFGNGVNDYNTDCAESYSDLDKAIAAFCEVLSGIRTNYIAVSDYRKQFNVSESYEFKQNEVVRLELQKFVDSDIAPWKKEDFEGVMVDSVLDLKEILGVGSDGSLEGWLQSEDFIA